MPMSRCTTFSLGNGKEEMSIRWDLANGEFEVQKQRIPGSTEEDKGRPQSVCIRTSDLSPQEWIELANSIYEAFGKLFTTFKNIDMSTVEMAERQFGCPYTELEHLLCDRNEEEDEEDEDN